MPISFRLLSFLLLVYLYYENYKGNGVAMVGWGIIGAGNVAEFKGGPALQQAGSSELRAIMRRDPQQTVATAKRMGVARAYSELEDILSDPDIDAVYIATPVAAHAPLAIAAAQAGKHVLLEKPMGLNQAECEQIIAACRQHNVQLGVAYYRRFYPIIERMHTMIEAGTIGVPLTARAQYITSHAPRTQPQLDWRLQPNVSGGGCLADVGSHRLDLLLALLGPVREVSATMDVWQPYGVERTATVLLNMANGAQATCSIAWGSGGFCDELEITGSEARLLASPLDGGRLIVVRGRNTTEEQLESMRPTHLGLVQDFVNAVLEDHAPRVSGAEGMATTILLDAAYRAARTHQVVQLV